MDISKDKWLTNLVNLAREVASWSKDESTKVGAVITTSDGKPLSWGFNGFPMGISDDVEHSDRNERPLKYRYTCHAERNALDLAASSVVNATMTVTLSPCTECAKSVIQRGVKTVVVDDNGSIDNAPVHWREDLTFAKGMLLEAGIDYMVHTVPN